MKKKLVTMLVAALAAGMLSMFALAGCGGGQSSAVSDEEQVLQAVQASIGEGGFDASGMVDEMKEDAEFVAMLDMVGVSVDDYVAPLAAAMEMVPGEVTVNGNEATAEVVVTMPDFAQLNEQLATASEEFAANVDQSKPQEELMKDLGQAMLNVVNNPELPTKTETFIAEYEKVGGDWKLQNASDIESEMKQAFGA